MANDVANILDLNVERRFEFNKPHLQHGHVSVHRCQSLAAAAAAPAPAPAATSAATAAAVAALALALSWGVAEERRVLQRLAREDEAGVGRHAGAQVDGAHHQGLATRSLLSST